MKDSTLAAPKDALRKEKRNARDRRRSQLKKDTMQCMRDEVAKLEVEKARLENCYGLSSVPRSIEDDYPPSETITDGDEKPGRRLTLVAAQQRYLRVLQCLDELRRENRAMAIQVHDRDLFRSAIHNCVDELEQQIAPQLSMGVDPNFSGRVDERMIPSTYLSIEDAEVFTERLRQRVESALAESATMHRFSGAQVFGWSDFRIRSGASINFVVKKSFIGRTPAELAQTTWQIASNSDRMRHLLPPNVIVDLQVLQRIGGDAILFDRRTHDARFGDSSPDVVLRTKYMLHRAQDDDGDHMLAMRTVPELQQGLHDHEVWCDIFYWFYFRSTRGENGRAQTETHFGGALTYRAEETARLWLAELVFLAVRWESLAVAPLLLRQDAIE